VSVPPYCGSPDGFGGVVGGVVVGGVVVGGAVVGGVVVACGPQEARTSAVTTRPVTINQTILFFMALSPLLLIGYFCVCSALVCWRGYGSLSKAYACLYLIFCFLSMPLVPDKTNLLSPCSVVKVGHDTIMV
jgi:hypothetical protein